ncbi:MAG: phosphatase PAP2 family protein [Bacteroidales bacterium]|jgi:hypothetical protein|nr:phosphatase PAP2 family protein [Bacteroidales bacterium]
MNFQRFTKKNIIINILLITIYILWNSFVVGIRDEHYFLLLLWLVSFYAGEKSRKFIIAFSIFIVYWIIYDSMRILPNYEVSQVHIIEPYEFEKALFGITVNNTLLTPNEYFAIYNTKFLDILSGLFYINWVPIPLAFGVYLFFKDKLLFAKFSIVFFLVNIFGFAIYYIYPAAPPWYVDLYGFDLQIGVPGNSARLSKFDEIVGLPIFENIYNKNANVLAAMPSLHATYPLIVLFYGIKKGFGWLLNGLFIIFMSGIWFAAVYSNHHYIVDILVGVIMTLVVIAVFEKLSFKPYYQRHIRSFINQI